MIIWILSNTQIYAIRLSFFLLKEIISAVKENLLKVSKSLRINSFLPPTLQPNLNTHSYTQQLLCLYRNINFYSANFPMFSIGVLLFGVPIYIAMLNIHNSIELIEFFLHPFINMYIRESMKMTVYFWKMENLLAIEMIFI